MLLFTQPQPHQQPHGNTTAAGLLLVAVINEFKASSNLSRSSSLPPPPPTPETFNLTDNDTIATAAESDKYQPNGDLVHFVTMTVIVLITAMQLIGTAMYGLRKRRGSLDFMNLLCFLSAVFSFLQSGVVFAKTVVDKATFHMLCPVNVTVQLSLIVGSRCVAHFVIHGRCRALNARDSMLYGLLSAMPTLVLTLSLAQIITAVVSFATVDTAGTCTLGQAPPVGATIIKSAYGVILLLQIVLLLAIIYPILAHCLWLQKSRVSNPEIQGVLVRVCVCGVFFVVSDLVPLAVAWIQQVFNQWMSLSCCLSLIINTTSILCSFSDYKQRMFPFVAFNSGGGAGGD